jgi:hypothetical protein
LGRRSATFGEFFRQSDLQIDPLQSCDRGQTFADRVELIGNFAESVHFLHLHTKEGGLPRLASDDVQSLETTLQIQSSKDRQHLAQHLHGMSANSAEGVIREFHPSGGV